MVIHNLKTGIHFLHFALDGEGTSVQSSCMIATEQLYDRNSIVVNKYL